MTDAIKDQQQRRRHRRRQQRAPREESDRLSNLEIEQAYDDVPEIGAGYRWYDYLWRLERWVASGWRRRFLTRSARSWLNDRANDLLQFNTLDRNKVWSRDSLLHNLFVPADEHVRVGGIWVVELFPPTELPALERALSRNGWGGGRAIPPHEQDNLAKLERSRTGYGHMWWRLADVLDVDAKSYFSLHAHRMHLPEPFVTVEIRAIQIGQSLTAAVAHFGLTDAAAESLDDAWHQDHEPVMIRENGRYRPLDRKSVSQRNIQDARRALHTTARKWLAERLPGAFAANGEPQLLVDLLLLDQYDPYASVLDTSNEDEVRFARVRKLDAYEAIGIDLQERDRITSESLPGLVLSPPRTHSSSRLADDPTWTLWGNAGSAKDGFLSRKLYHGASVEHSVALTMEDTFGILPVLAISDYLFNARARYARLRDRASTRHGKFKAKALRELRGSFLTLSLNITTMRRDVRDFWKWRSVWGSSDFQLKMAPHEEAYYREKGREPRPPKSLDDILRKRLNKDLARLVEVDLDYRDILSTVASLGASADAFKIGRWALLVAIASLAVASATILIADIGCGSILHELFGWPSTAECVTAPIP